ncbi:MAG: hypothetical protein Q4C96_11105, partial [Planctomycetia bacterium]|nr:hypothetical protein [Planctomycetia bacterium]
TPTLRAPRRPSSRKTSLPIFFTPPLSKLTPAFYIRCTINFRRPRHFMSQKMPTFVATKKI